MQTKDQRLNDYLDTFIRREMCDSLKSYLSGKQHDKQISISLSKIVKITMVYNSGLAVKTKQINKMLSSKDFDEQDKAIKAYYNTVSKKAKKIYAKHRMALLRIEEVFYERDLSEGPCLAMKLLYLTGCNIPDDRGRYMPLNTNKSSVELAVFMELCNFQNNSAAYSEKAYNHRLKKSQKKDRRKDVTDIPPIDDK